MTPRDQVLAAFHAACARVDLPGRVADALAASPRAPTIVIAAGKCAHAMARGALDALGADCAEALVVVPHGAGFAPNDARETWIEASHPVPDAASVQAADAALALAARDDGDGGAERLFLVSGGASSLLCAPVPGLLLERKRAIVQALLQRGAPIADINVVRRHLSHIKGGGLARACGTHARRTLLVSDVLGGGPEDVGSGPSVADPSTLADAKAVAERIGLEGWEELPWVETWKRQERVDVIADPALFGALVCEELRRAGLAVRRMDATPTGDVGALADAYADAATRLAPREAFVGMAEPPVLVDVAAPGHGGRSTHLAALLAGRLPRGVLFAAIATDGVDGSSETGGAIVEGGSPTAIAVHAAEAVARFDTGPLHVRAGTAIPQAPTGLNFADLHVLARFET